MAAKDYYAILGIQPGASETEIKRAYRRLAVAFHPDKNPDPAAENLFKEINEAYDVIGDPEKKRTYDLITRHPGITLAPDARRHRDPAYHRRRAPGPRPAGERERMYAFMARYLPHVRALTFVSTLMAFVVIVDFIFPERIITERISKTSVSRTSIGRSNRAWWTITTADGRRFELDMYVRDHFPEGAEVRVRLSPLLSIPVSVEASDHNEPIGKSVYGNFIFAPVILIIAAAVAVVFRNDVEKGFNYGIVAFLSLMLAMAIFLILHG